jgi:hypothetical protein
MNMFSVNYKWVFEKEKEKKERKKVAKTLC